MHGELFPELTKGEWRPINLDAMARLAFPARTSENPLLDPYQCEEWMKGMREHYQFDYSYGGYLEDREHLWRKHYMWPTRTIHLGIDYNVPEKTKVHLPCDGTVVAVEQDGSNGGWGGKVVVRTETCHIIFGHLGWDHQLARFGWRMHRGDMLGVVGPIHQNGFWYPHLHVQCVLDWNKDMPIDGYGHRKDPSLALRYPDPRGWVLEQ